MAVGHILQQQVPRFGLRRVHRIEAAQQKASRRGRRHGVIELHFSRFRRVLRPISRFWDFQDQRGGRLLGGTVVGESEAHDA